MRSWATNTAIVFGSMLVASMPLSAEAHTTHHTPHASHHGSASSAKLHSASAAGRHSRGRYASAHGRYGHARYAGISCVPFARNETGIALTGNAASWWDEAEGRYARGGAPEAGSILNFRANASMHLGHVAVVRDVVNSRQIEIDQANWWGPGGGHGVVSRDVSVVDVSPHNDWTAVRVALGHSGNFGSVYPTYGFIYQRPDGSDPAPVVMTAAATGTGILNPAPRDLRPRHERTQLANVTPVTPDDEVAEAPATAAAGPLLLDAPDRNLR